MEVWKDIDGWQGLYQVSNIGRIKSLERRLLKRIKPESILKPRLNHNGYLRILFRTKKHYKNEFVHRLVANTFLLKYSEKLQVNHINGIKTDNNVSNLEWCTPSENRIHAYKTGLQNRAKGQNHSMSKLTEDQAKEIKYGFIGMNHLEVAKIFGITRHAVGLIRNNKRWTHI
jgi:hypothetical protein